MATTEPEWLSRKRAASYLTARGYPISPQTLARLASNENAGKGPPFYRDPDAKRLTTYRREDLDAWREKRMVRVG